jgi:hypothetical protein
MLQNELAIYHAVWTDGRAERSFCTNKLIFVSNNLRIVITSRQLLF